METNIPRSQISLLHNSCTILAILMLFCSRPLASIKLMKQTAPLHSPHARKHSTKRATVQLSGWGSPELKAELERIAASEGITLSQTIVAACEAVVRAKHERRRDVLEKPILEAFFDRKMNQVVNRLAEFLGRSVYEIGQLRWLYVNTLYHDTLRKIATAKTSEQKEALQQAFYQLLDTSQKETVKAARHWNPNIIDVVATIKAQLKEEPA
jgi:hypothetical protein